MPLRLFQGLWGWCRIPAVAASPAQATPIVIGADVPAQLCSKKSEECLLSGRFPVPDTRETSLNRLAQPYSSATLPPLATDFNHVAELVTRSKRPAVHRMDGQKQPKTQTARLPKQPSRSEFYVSASIERNSRSIGSESQWSASEVDDVGQASACAAAAACEPFAGVDVGVF